LQWYSLWCWAGHLRELSIDELTTSCAKLERCASTTPSSNCDVLAHLRGRLRRSYEMPVGRRSRAVTKGHESSIRPSRTPQPPRSSSQQCGRITRVYCAPSARPGRAACARRGWAVPQPRRRAAPSPTDVPDPAAPRSGRTCREYGLRESASRRHTRRQSDRERIWLTPSQASKPKRASSGQHRPGWSCAMALTGTTDATSYTVLGSHAKPRAANAWRNTPCDNADRGREHKLQEL
jgi:hypothetical protein